MIFGRRGFFGYAPDDVGGTVWFANIPHHASSRAERDGTPAEQWNHWLMDRFAGDHGPATELIAAGHGHQIEPFDVPAGERRGCRHT